MAKGLRSKSKRKNRSILRAVLSEPIIRKRQENLATDLQKDLTAKSGGSITALKNVLSFRSGELSKEDEVQSHLNEDEDDDVEVAEFEDPAVGNLVVKNKTISSNKGKRTAIHKASKNLKHKKNLEWF
eukprot:gene23394-31737_t